MGCSFLSKPVTEKLSEDKSNDRLCYGASSMQGWRVSQEDDHNCLLDFDTNTSFFAVYDGHGGHEVAQYCSQNLPKFIKDTAAYKEDDLKRALVEGFLGFDGTIITPEVVEILTKIAGENLNDGSDDDDDEENIDNLYEEAAMPIEKVIEKYKNLVNPALKNLKKGEYLKSPFLKAKKDVSDVASGSDTSGSRPETTEDIKSEDIKSEDIKSDDIKSDDVKSEDIKSEDIKSEDIKSEDIKSEDIKSEDIKSEDIKSEDMSGVNSSNLETIETNTSDNWTGETVKSLESNGAVPQIKVSSPDSSESKESDANTETPKNDKSESSQNGEISDKNFKVETNSSPQENGDVISKGKGKATAKKTPKTPVVIRPKRNASQLYKALLNFGQDSEEDDTEDEDKTFEGPNEESSNDEDEGVNVSIEVDGSEDSSTDEVEDEEEDEEEDEDDDDDEMGPNRMGIDGVEKPGSDSGCTAVVAVLRGNELYVANAGDSRCIVCRNGKAIEMSLDHKPEDTIERQRIEKAGGKVNWEGRVNGGLNLSRAIGDHSYKQNKELSDREQMITSLPDIKTLTVNPNEDEFMVLACDGIWNFMSSQEVVDFVRPRIKTCGDKLSTICEEMFDHCLAPNTSGDGTGCDNMTAIIVRFKNNILKRSASPEPADIDSKRAKTEEKQHIESTV